MKKIVFIFLLSIYAVYSQESPKTLTIVGEASKQITIDNYELTISLKEIIADGYQQLEPKSLSEVKKTYSDKLKAIGVDFGKFKRNKLYQIYSSYSEVNDVVYYTYTTSSEEEVLQIIGERTRGLMIVQVQVNPKDKTNEELAQLTVMAVADATTKAEKIAKKLNNKLGKIMKIENSDPKSQYLSGYSPEEIQKHLVTVTFSLKQ